MYNDTGKITGSDKRRDSQILEHIIAEVNTRVGTIDDMTTIGEAVVELLMTHDYIEEVD